MRFLVPLTAALVPLLITPGLVSHFDVTPKIAVLLLGTALLLSYRGANVQNLYNLLKKPAGSWLVGVLGASWICAAIATLLSTHPLLSLNGSSWRRMGLIPETALLVFVVLAAAWLAADGANTRYLLRACAVSGIVSGAYGIAQYFGLDPLLPVSAYQVGEGRFMIVRPPGTLGHADYFAAWLVTIVFFALAQYRLETQRPWKLCACAAAALAVLAIVFSGTRSAMLGLVVGGLVFIAVNRPSVRRATVLAGVAALALLVVLFFSPAGMKLRARLHWSLEDMRGGARLLLWRDSLVMSASRPIAGYGPETFTAEFPHFQSSDLARALPDFYQESPHNMFLDALDSEGLAGLFVLLCSCVFGSVCALHAARMKRPLAGPLAAAWVSLLVTQQFIVLILPTLLFFHLILAMLVADLAPETSETEATVRAPALMFVASAAVILLFAAYGFRLIFADRALETAERSSATGRVRSASQAYQIVLNWQLPGTSDDLDYSRAMHRLATSTRELGTSILARRQALEAATRATTTAEDRQNAWYNLAMLKAENNDARGTERALRSAIDCAPNWFKPHWTLARLLAMTNRPTEALTEADLAVGLDGGHDAEVMETWKTLQKKADQAR
jgi:O-antigen ligase